MKLISHRGNINGRVPEMENNPEYIQKAIELGYDVEVDLRTKDGKLYFGHDEAQYPADAEWLDKYSDKLWFHVKTMDIFEAFHRKDPRGYEVKYFWHENDTITLTSSGHIWAYPGKQPIAGSIAVLPELNNDNVDGCYGVCSDYIENYKK